MYAIIDTGGFQQKVALGDTVRVQKIASAAGTFQHSGISIGTAV